jgi:hypothetical protein
VALEAMSGRDRHPPGRDLGRAKVADPAIAERADRLGEQPSKLRNRFRLTVVLREVDVDELAEPGRLDETLLSPEALERPLERLGRGLLRRESAPLHTPRAAPTSAITVSPQPPPVGPHRPQFEDLSLLPHCRSLLSRDDS